MSDDHLKLREEVRAKLAAWVQPTFRHDGDPDPHPDEDALVDRLTDGVVLPYELKLREVLVEVDQLRTRAREEIERRSYAVTHAKVCEEKCDKALAEAEQLRSAQTFLDGQVFAAGWYAHAKVSASLGWDQREAAWRQYREEMAETLAESVPQQPAPEPEPPTRRSVLLAAIQREGGDWSPLRACTALVNAGHPVESNRAHEIMKTLAAHGYLEQVRPRAYTYRLKTEAVQQPVQDEEAEQ